MAITSDDPEAAPRVAALEKGLSADGWMAGGNVQVTYRWSGADPDKTRSFARELVDLHPDVLVAHGSPGTAELVALDKSTPIVFVLVADPVGSGFVTTLGPPSGNVTGYVNFDASLMGKWVQLLREIDPQLNRVLMLFNPDTAPDRGAFFLQPLTEAASTIGVQAISGQVKSDADIETAIASLVAIPHGGIVAPPDVFITTERAAIIQSAAAHGVPAIYPYRFFADGGGLMSYGIDTTDVFRQVGDYAGQILNGTRVSNLPIRAPNTFQFVVNLKTAKSLGITVPQAVLASADAVIE